MRLGRPARIALALGLLLAALPSGARGTTPKVSPGLELVGTFVAGIPISGAELSKPFLYVSTAHELLIYDVSEPLEPRLVGSNSSDHLIHGELLPTNDRIMLLNDWPGGSTVDIWDVENKEDPQRVERLTSILDEHFGCVLDCRWAYGSEGTILDLRRPLRTKALDRTWTDAAGFEDPMHRLDEFRPGYLLTASSFGPTVIDARRPLHPRVVGRGEQPPGERRGFLYSEWPLGGKSRYLLSSVERYARVGECGEDPATTLYTYDTKGWPERKTFPRVGEYALQGSCSAYYFAFHPRFEENGVIALPHGFNGVRLLRIDSRGQLREIAAYEPAAAEIWHTFWINEKILYVFNVAGQVYILRYED